MESLSTQRNKARYFFGQKYMLVASPNPFRAKNTLVYLRVMVAILVGKYLCAMTVEDI